MLEKTETSKNDIPKELIVHIQKELESGTETDRSHFALTSRLFHCNQDERLLLKLLEFVCTGNQIRAQKLLEFRPDLAAKRASFTDWFGDTLRCSPFEYALSDKDLRYMCPMMLDCLPINEEGEDIRIELDNQLKVFEIMGLTCTSSDGKTYTKTYFSLEPLKQALKTYIDNFDNWTWPQRETHWCTGVGQAQLRLPAHIRQHYCDPDESFDGKPTFTKAEFTRSLKFYNYLKNDYESWDKGLTGLGVDFAMGGSWGAGLLGLMGGMERGDRYRGTIDLAAIAALDEMRTKTDLPLLKQRLKSPLQKLVATLESQCVIS